jgi:hypothetical protein
VEIAKSLGDQSIDGRIRPELLCGLKLLEPESQD